MNITDYVVVFILLSMALISGLIGYEFQRSSDYNKMRSLWMELFWSKSYLYSAYAIYYVLVVLGIISGLPLSYAFILVNLPTFVTKIRLWLFIRK